jgi:hypothetical protein
VYQVHQGEKESTGNGSIWVHQTYWVTGSSKAAYRRCISHVSQPHQTELSDSAGDSMVRVRCLNLPTQTVKNCRRCINSTCQLIQWIKQ